MIQDLPKHIKGPADEIDAALFSSDEMRTKEHWLALVDVIERWKRWLYEHRALLMDDLAVSDASMVMVRKALSLRPLGAACYVYRNAELNPSAGQQEITIMCGPGCTHEAPPPHAHDGPWGTGWRYKLLGRINPELGVVMPMLPATVVMTPYDAEVVAPAPPPDHGPVPYAGD